MKFLVASLLALAPVAAQAATRTALNHEITCTPETARPDQPTLVTLKYGIRPIAIVDNDVHGSAIGRYSMLIGDRQTGSGRVTGTITPRIWYGGSLDLDLNGIRVLFLRSTPNVAWIDLVEGEELSKYLCEGDLPD